MQSNSLSRVGLRRSSRSLGDVHRLFQIRQEERVLDSVFVGMQQQITIVAQFEEWTSGRWSRFYQFSLVAN